MAEEETRKNIKDPKIEAAEKRKSVADIYNSILKLEG